MTRTTAGPCFRTVLASAAFIAALGPLAALAQTAVPVPDEATAAAIQQWRAASLALVDSASQDAVAMSYGDEAVATDNATLIKRAAAEQQAFATLDPTAVRLIEDYYASAQASGADGHND